MSELFKLLPAVDVLLSHPLLESVLKTYKRDVVRERCRFILQETRQQISHNKIAVDSKKELTERVAQNVLARLESDFAPSLHPVINATGIVLHTGLGRAPLSQAAQDNINRVMHNYSNIELDMASGKRGERTDHIRKLLCELTGAEHALLVNNNAAAVFLALNTLAFGKEAIISRGQLVEIGGSFRIPDVMEKSGVLMREVGTTNKTKLVDYENAINDHTGAIVVAHTSNYRVLGFTAEVELKDVVELAHAHNLPVIHDLGAGVIVDFEALGLPYEPLVQDSIKAGVDVITFSGDKVLGGPQSGLIVGCKTWLTKIHKNPIMRAVRCDKLIYAAMEATLKLYFQNNLLDQHAVLQMMTEPVEQIKKRAHEILNKIDSKIIKKYHIRIQQSQAQFGSGALPLEKLESVALVLKPDASPDDLAAHLRHNGAPIIGYIQEDCVWLDMRTVRESESNTLAQRLNEL